MSSRIRWIAFTGRGAGSLVIDDGAATAIVEKGKSLLAAGITAVAGPFKIGDMVDILDTRGAVLARGISDFSSADIDKVRGHRAQDIAAILGDGRDDPVVIHRNNMVLV